MDAEMERPAKRGKFANEDVDESIEASATPTSTEAGDQPPDEIDPTQPLAEAQVGITEYLHPELPGFTGVLKARDYDFIVNEITPAGEVVHLKSLDCPIEPMENGESSPAEISNTGVSLIMEPSKAHETLRTMIPDEETIAKITDAISTLRSGSAANSQQPASEIARISVPDKEQRRNVHSVIRDAFGDVLDTTGTQEGEIVFTPKIEEGGDRRNRGKNRAPSKGTHRGVTKERYLEFTLVKEGSDTLSAVNTISRMLRIKSKDFSYAGTKDRKAVTTQKMTLFRTSAERLFALNKGLPSGLRVGDFRYRKTSMGLGDLSGNHFKIALRDVKHESEAATNAALEIVKASGFVNYFGMQRFGTRSAGTYIPGIHMIKGQYEEAVEAILAAKPGEREEFAKARAHWQETKNASTAIKLFPRSALAERAILTFFEKSGRLNDYWGALQAIPRNMRSLYMHAYQSLVWNHMVSERLRLYGHSVVLGDLVNVSAEQQIDPSVEDGADDVVRRRAPDADSRMQVAVVKTDDDLQKYTIHDVVLPLPGYSVLYPENSVREKYTEFMKQHELDPFKMRTNNRETSLPGAYRHIVGLPKSFSWECVRYDAPDEKLMLTDLDQVNGAVLDLNPDGARFGLVLEFSLKTSHYATMLLRECMRQSTTAAYHAQMSTDLGINVKSTSAAQTELAGEKKSSLDMDQQPRESVKRNCDGEHVTA
ncbi:hypothetical protein HDU85_007739 [Gaertneriomyces sp. JEL0708]|nr:hypothetical protein HDU85_007739 [Gaertneriomyces sp. JEL0708]